MRFLPWVYAATVIGGEELPGASPYETVRKCGFCIEETVAEELDMSRGIHTVTVGGCRSVHTVTALDRPGITVEEMLGYAIDYACKERLTGELQCREDLRPRQVYYEYWLSIQE